MPIFALIYGRPLYQAFLVAQVVKNPTAMWETRVRPLGWEDHLEKGLATHSSILARKIPWAEELGRLYSTGPQRVRLTEHTQPVGGRAGIQTQGVWFESS